MVVIRLVILLLLAILLLAVVVVVRLTGVQDLLVDLVVVMQGEYGIDPMMAMAISMEYPHKA
jgi:hypothetical protein